MRHLALLRGINVGGRNLLPMRDLAGLFEDAGCREVRTYIQSGNVLFSAEPALAEALPARLAAAILERHGLKVPVLLRDLEQLRRAVAGNPFLAAGEGEAHLHLMFLAEVPAPARAAALDPDFSPGDRFAVRGREIYLVLPNGTARSRLTNAWFDARLETVSTLRNWRTATRLLELLEA